MGFLKAKKSQIAIKLAITGVSGSGKTYSALLLARGLVGDEGRIAVIDTENGSASLYADLTDYDVLNISPPFFKKMFLGAIKDAIDGGYQCLIIDSASHIWEGVLAYKSNLDAAGGNSYVNWGQAGSAYKEVIDAILQSPLHVICCMRSKTEYVIEQNEKGKQVPRKIGLAPIIRDGTEYEFTTVFDVAPSHKAIITKDRTGLFDQNDYFIIDVTTGLRISDWLKRSDRPRDDNFIQI